MTTTINRIRLYGSEQAGGALWVAMKTAAPEQLHDLARHMFIGERGMLLDDGSFGPKAGPKLTFGVMPYEGDWRRGRICTEEVAALVEFAASLQIELSPRRKAPEGSADFKAQFAPGCPPEDRMYPRIARRVANPEIPRDAHLAAMRSFADDVGGDVGKLLRVMADARADKRTAASRERLFVRGLEAIGRLRDYEPLREVLVDELGIDRLRPMPRLVWRGRALSKATFAVADAHFGEGEYARDAVDGGRVLDRACHVECGSLCVSARVRSSFYESRAYEPYVHIDLLDGSITSASCAECSYYEEENERYYWTSECECRHGAAVMRAFLLDPRSFDGCPAGLEAYGGAE